MKEEITQKDVLDLLRALETSISKKGYFTDILPPYIDVKERLSDTLDAALAGAGYECIAAFTDELKTIMEDKCLYDLELVNKVVRFKGVSEIRIDDILVDQENLGISEWNTLSTEGKIRALPISVLYEVLLVLTEALISACFAGIVEEETPKHAGSPVIRRIK
jgi:hypothetical protein